MTNSENMITSQNHNGNLRVSPKGTHVSGTHGECEDDTEFKILLSGEDIDKIDEKIRNGGNDAETQNKDNPTNGIILLNTCANWASSTFQKIA